MKKYLFQFLLFVFIPWAGFSQADITVGAPYPVIDAFQKIYFQEGDEILSVKIMRRDIFLQKFNAKNLSFIQVKTYKSLPKNAVVEKIAKFSNRYYVFYSLWDKKNKEEQLFAKEIDFKSGTFINDGKLIAKVKGTLTNSSVSFDLGEMRIYSTYKFNVYCSYDSSKILIQSRFNPKKTNDSKSYDVIVLNVFNQNLDPDWSTEVKMPYTEKKMNNIDYSIDSEGNAFILSTVFNDNTTDIKKSKDSEANYHIELLRIKANTSHIEITPIEIADKFINQIGLYENPNKYMICAGFYNKGKNLNNASGIILFKIGKDGSSYDINTYDINKDQSEFKYLNLKEIIIEKDGTLLVIGEQNYVTEHHSYSPNGRLIVDYIVSIRSSTYFLIRKLCLILRNEKRLRTV